MKNIVKFLKKNIVGVGAGLGLALLLLPLLFVGARFVRNNFLYGVGSGLLEQNMIMKNVPESASLSFDMDSMAPSASRKMAYAGDIMPAPIEPGTGNGPESLAEQKIIRTGDIAMVVDKIDTASKDIEAIIKQVGGFIESTNFGEYGENTASGRITVRVPVDKFFDAFEKIKQSAINVTSQSTGRQDVTAQYKDYELQLASHRSAFARYQALMSRAQNIEEILKVQEKMDQEKNQIERLEGSLKQLSNQTTYSTININLTSEAEVKIFGITWSPMSTIRHAFNQLLTNLTTGFIDPLIFFVVAKAIPWALWLVVWVIAFVVGWKFARFIFTRFLRKK